MSKVPVISQKTKFSSHTNTSLPLDDSVSIVAVTSANDASPLKGTRIQNQSFNACWMFTCVPVKYRNTYALLIQALCHLQTCFYVRWFQKLMYCCWQSTLVLPCKWMLFSLFCIHCKHPQENGWIKFTHLKYSSTYFKYSSTFKIFKYLF